MSNAALIFSCRFKYGIIQVSVIEYLGEYVLDPSHTSCVDPGTPLFGYQNNTQGYQVSKHIKNDKLNEIAPHIGLL